MLKLKPILLSLDTSSNAEARSGGGAPIWQGDAASQTIEMIKTYLQYLSS